MNYKSYQDLSLTINKNFIKIPRDIDLVVGVPRSGMLPATMIGQILNKPVVALDSYLDGKLYEIGLYRRPHNLATNYSGIKKVLIIDDTINSGASMNKIKERIRNSDKHEINTIYCAVYYVRESADKIDIGFEECSWPCVFQWNILNCWVLAQACLDIDGVVCVDPTEEQNDDGERYRNFLSNAKPLFLTEFPISCFVTSRLEKYRSLTEAWLKQHHFKYGELMMLNLPSKEERLRQNIHAKFKAEVYKNRNEELFIESNSSQALQISKLTNKLVFCTETMEMMPHKTNTDSQETNIYPLPDNHLPVKNISTQTTDSEKEVSIPNQMKRILFVNHSIYPFENSGTPISTLNHALGMKELGMDVAVLIPSPDVKAGYEKQRNEKFVLYKLPRLDKYKAFFGEVEPLVLDEYFQSVKNILADFRPDVVQINDYVYMPETIISLFHDCDIRVIRNVCNMEELCHMDYPVISNGLQGKLCKGPQTSVQCAECFFVNKLHANPNEIHPNQLQLLSEKIQKRFDSIKSLYENYVDGVIFTEKTFQDYFIGFVNIRKEKTTVIPRGFEFNYARRTEPKMVNGNTIRFGYVGHMMFSKGTDVILKTFEELAATENFQLNLYGAIVDDAYRDWIVRLGKEYPSKIKYHGQYNKANMMDIANAIDVAIVPSNFDTYNRIVRELLYLGIPQIVTEFFGASVIRHNINGLKIGIGDSKAMAQMMKTIIDNPDLVHELSEGVIQTQIPALKDEVRAMYNFYQNIIGSALVNQKIFIDDKKQDQNKSTRLIALYLPQYHPTAENDNWWGKGFTEWTNVASAKPLFPGHYQPQIPADLGFYDLRLPEVREAQAEMAKQNGIYGFCYYHYWFNGKRLLNLPIDEVLSSGKPDFPFCFCWANEHWTRAWDGHQGEILMEQKFSETDDRNHIKWLLRVFQDKRYIRIQGKPLMIVYLSTRLPDAARTAEIWRDEAKKFGEELYLCKVESAPYEYGDPKLIGFDASIEFQPDWGNLGQPIKQLNGGHIVFDYATVSERMMKKPIPSYKRFPCVTPSWDNSPRRKQGSLIINGSKPEYYEKWLQHVVKNISNYHLDEQFVFINAWNEWGEGNHLEPDLKFGNAYLEATKRVVLGIEHNTISRTKQKLVSIIILTYNGLEFTKKCVESIQKNTNSPHEIIFVDNASNDGTVNYLKRLAAKHSNYSLVLNSTNRGFPAGNNLGIAASKGDYIILLNNDVVLTKDWLEGLIECAERKPEIGIVGPMTNYISGIQREETAIYKNIQELPKFAFEYRKKHFGEWKEYPRITGFCMLIKRSVIQSIGGLDPIYGKGNFEDDDFCLRARQKGFTAAIACDVFIHHYGSKSFRAGGTEKYVECLKRNEKVFEAKWGGNFAEVWGNKNLLKNVMLYVALDLDGIDETYAHALERYVAHNYAEALQQFAFAEHILNECPSGESETTLFDIMMGRGDCYLQMEQLQEAKESYEKALNINPESAEACYGIGLCFLYAGLNDAARQMFEATLALKPEWEKVKEKLAECTEVV